MSGRRMNIRRCRGGSSRLRFYHAHDDQIETIQLGLERARQELGTDFDVVALEAIIMGYLSGGDFGASSGSLEDALKRLSPEDVVAAFEQPTLNSQKPQKK